MATLFVSMLYDLYPKEKTASLSSVSQGAELSQRDICFRLQQLAHLTACDIDLVLFVDPELLGDLPPLTPRVTVIPLDLAEISVYRRLLIASNKSALPANRHQAKDTAEFLALINAKNELVARAAKEYPMFAYYAWIDANIFKIFDDVSAAKSRLKLISELSVGDRIAVPMGRYPMIRPEYGFVTDLVWWRFLGGLWICPRERLTSFNQAFDCVLAECIARGTLTWEVNVYARVEMLNPDWFAGYPAEHDQRMLDLPAASLDRRTPAD
jgi:hypothetical protein